MTNKHEKLSGAIERGVMGTSQRKCEVAADFLPREFNSDSNNRKNPDIFGERGGRGRGRIEDDDAR